MRVLLIVIFLFNLSSSPLAQTADLIHYDLEDGLPAVQITCLKKDRKGYLWIGTKGGVSRFDGLHFKNFTEKDGLIFNHALELYESEDGIWVVTKLGLSLISNTQEVSSFPLPAKEGYIGSTIEKDSLTILLHHHATGTDRNTIAFDTDKKEYNLNYLPNYDIFFIDQDYELLRSQSASKDSWDIHIREDAHDSIRLLTNMDLKPVHNSLHHAGQAVFVRIYSTEGGESTSFYTIKKGLPQEYCKVKEQKLLTSAGYSATISSSNELIYHFPNSGRIGVLDLESRESYNIPLNVDAVTAIEVLEDGTMFIGTEKSLCKLMSIKFHAYGEAEGLPKSQVWSTAKLDGEHFVSVYGSGIYRKKQGSSQFQLIKDSVLTDLKGNHASYMYNGVQKTPWNSLVFPYSEGGFHLQKGKFAKLKPDTLDRYYWLGSWIDTEKEEILGFGYGIDFFEKSGEFIGRLHAESIADGNRFDLMREGLQPFDTLLQTKIIANSVFDVERVNPEEYFIAMGGSQAIYNRKTGLIRELKIPISVTDSVVSGLMSLALDKWGTVWGGCLTGEAGLIMYRNGKFSKVASHIIDGIVDNVAVVNEGRILMASRRDGGLLAIHLSRFYQYLKAEDKSSVANPFYFFDKSNGFLYGQEPQQNSLVANGPTEVLFTTAEGKAYEVDIDTNVFNLPDRPNYIHTIEAFDEESKSWTAPLNNQPVPSNDTLQLEPNQRYVRLFFHGLTHNAPEQLRYVYRIRKNGEESNWFKVEGAEVVLPLSVGEQQLEVKSYYQFQESDQARAKSVFTLYLAPYWYETFWFYIGVGMALLASFFLVFYKTREVVRKENERKNRFQKLQQERELLERDQRLKDFKLKRAEEEQEALREKERTAKAHAATLETKNKEIQAVLEELQQKNAQLNQQQEENLSIHENYQSLLKDLEVQASMMPSELQQKVQELEERYQMPFPETAKDILLLLHQLSDGREELNKYIEQGVQNENGTSIENWMKFVELARAASPALIKRLNDKGWITPDNKNRDAETVLVTYLLRDRTLYERARFSQRKDKAEKGTAYRSAVKRLCEKLGVTPNSRNGKAGETWEQALIRWADGQIAALEKA